jgi:hypothetical protein
VKSRKQVDEGRSSSPLRLTASLASSAWACAHPPLGRIDGMCGFVIACKSACRLTGDP